MNLLFDKTSSSCRNFNQTKSKALASISYGDNKILFDYKNDRKDEGGLLLNNIFIYNKTQLIKREELIYDEIYNNERVQDPRLSSNPYIHYRYFLKEIKSYDSSNILQNKHSFDYYDLTNLPPRLSWNKDIYGYYNAKTNNSPFDKKLIVDSETRFIVRNQTSSFTADLSVNPNTVYYGMLKRITYPSKGFSDIAYESNSSNVNAIKEVNESIDLSAQKNACSGGNSSNSEKSFEFISNGQSIHFTSSFTAEKCPGHENDVIDFHDVYNISIYNITNGSNTLIFRGSGRYDQIIKTVEEGEPTNSNNFSPIKTVNNNKYKIVVQAETKFDKVYLFTTFKYNKKYEPYIYKEYYGGARVKSTNNFDGLYNSNKKEYIYTSFQEKDSDFTTIKENNPPRLYDKSIVTITCTINSSLPQPIENAIKLAVNNSSINQLFNTRSQNVSYGIITTLSSDNNKNNGYTENYFYNNSENNSDTYQGSKIYGTPTSNNSEGYTNSLLMKKVYNSNHLLLSETENIYNSIKNNKIFTNWVFKKNYEFSFPVMEEWIYNHSIERYQNFSPTVKPTKTITKEHFPNGTLTTETNYNYDSANHLQLTSQTTKNSKGETITTEYQYPPDLTGNYIQNAEMIKLVNTNRISEPVIINQKVGDVYTSEVRNQYNEFNGIIQKSAVYQKKGKDIGLGGTYDRVIKYDSYDTKGNLTQYTLENGIPVSIIWGYGGQYPVAKIEGVALSQISNATILNLNTKTTDSELLTAITALRTAHKDAMVTGYLYKPLVGVTQIIQPNGMTEKYHYDAANRLQSIVNNQNEVIKTFEYNYKQP